MYYPMSLWKENTGFVQIFFYVSNGTEIKAFS